MVFHMLRSAIGDKAFDRVLRELVQEKRFQRASWEDIKKIVGKNSGKKWEWFFKQWVDEPGIPDLYAGAFDVKQDGTKYDATFTVGQRGKVYRLELPLTVYCLDGSVEHLTVKADKEKDPVTISVDGVPEKIVIDERYDIFRRLDTESFRRLSPGS